MCRVSRVVGQRRPARVFRRHSAARLALCLVAPVLIGACASPGKLNSQLARHLEAGNYAAGVALLEEEKERSFGGKNALLYHLERGMLLHYDGSYAESNRSFNYEKQMISDWLNKKIKPKLACLK